MKKFKLGLDIHGVIDANPELFALMSNLLVDAGHEVHVLTGSMKSVEILEELKSYGMKWTHFFSIADHNKQMGTAVTYDENGNPWMDRDAWNRSKGDYCRIKKIDLCIDDTIVYGDYFTTPFARFFSKHIPKHVKEVKTDSDFSPDPETMKRVSECVLGDFEMDE